MKEFECPHLVKHSFALLPSIKYDKQLVSFLQHVGQDLTRVVCHTCHISKYLKAKEEL
jgi:hypothetical protein